MAGKTPRPIAGLCSAWPWYCKRPRKQGLVHRDLKPVRVFARLFRTSENQAVSC